MEKIIESITAKLRNPNGTTKVRWEDFSSFSGVERFQAAFDGTLVLVTKRQIEPEDELEASPGGDLILLQILNRRGSILEQSIFLPEKDGFAEAEALFQLIRQSARNRDRIPEKHSSNSANESSLPNHRSSQRLASPGAGGIRNFALIRSIFSKGGSEPVRPPISVLLNRGRSQFPSRCGYCR